MNNSPSSWPSRLLSAAVAVVVAALLFRWAWMLIRPLLPVIVVVAVLVIAFRFWQRRDNW
jgi:Flp pilus assembly protein TadB